MSEKFPASFRYLPSCFGDASTDNGTVLKAGSQIYREPFSRLEPAPVVLGVNKRSTKINTQLAFGDLYVVWAVGTSLYKIGVSGNFARRFKDLAASSPLPLLTVKYARCDNPHLLESRLHDLFASRLFKNEWFSLEEADLDTIESIVSVYYEAPNERV